LLGGKHSTKEVCRFIENTLSIREVITSSNYAKKIIIYWEVGSLERKAVGVHSNIYLTGKAANISHDIEFVAAIRTAQLPSIGKKLYSYSDCSL
jgi:hypothetical protein